METVIERYIQDCELQLVERADGSLYFDFYAARWYDPKDPGTEYQLPSGRLERIERHAFDDVLDDPETRLRINHSRDFDLGDKSTGLVLRTDQYGLRSIHPFDPTDVDHQKARSKITKKLAKGASFKATALLRFERQGNNIIQWVTKITRLEDVSIVDRPAYKGTTAMMRCEHEEEIERQYQEWIESERQKEEDRKLIEKLDQLTR